MARALRRLPAQLADGPLIDLDERTTGGEVEWFREGLTHVRREDAYWVARDFAAGVAEVTAPVQLIGGWYDIFLPWMLEDAVALREAGNKPQLIIGPWTHTAPGLVAAGQREGLAWLRARLLGDDRLVRPAHVSVYVTGEPSGGGWRELPSWPPPGTGQWSLWLGENRSLSERPPVLGGGDRYRYDPIEPTPSAGGPVLLERAPVLDNRQLEARADVLTYTTEALPDTVEAIGPVAVELWVKASSEYFDVFARVCDVEPDGPSWNVCDALARVSSDAYEREEDGAWHIKFNLWPMGHRFARGHGIRLQISSGAHPRYVRNPGTGEDAATATRLRAVDVEILHGGARASRLLLPALGSS
jgi:putative CocE/NonD family hydrolase